MNFSCIVAKRGLVWSYLKKRILVPRKKRAGSATSQDDRVDQPGGILQYFDELNLAPNAEIEPEDFFEMAFCKTAGSLRTLARASNAISISDGLWY